MEDQRGASGRSFANLSIVIAGLVPAIPLRKAKLCVPFQNGRDKPGHDTALIPVDVCHDSWFGLRNEIENRRHQWPKGEDVIARRMNDDYGKRNIFEALLVFKISIDRDQNIECCRREPQQLAVFDAGPAGLGNCLDLMAKNIVAQRASDALVK